MKPVLIIATLLFVVPQTKNDMSFHNFKLNAIDGSEISFDAYKGKKVLLVGLAEQPSYMLRKSKVIPILIPEESLFTNFKECLASLTSEGSDSSKLKFKSKKLTFRVKK